MQLKTLPLGAFETNTYLLFFEAEKQLLIIDPAAEAELIFAAAKAFPWQTARILLTHAHVDHIAGCPETAKRFNVTNVEVAPADVPLYKSPANAILPYFPATANLPETVSFVPLPGNGRVLALPGHTPGGSGFLFDDVLIAGDTIFHTSIGRTDLPGGDFDTLINSIKNEIFTLPDKTRISCGHGPATTVGYEKQHNPYLPK